MNQARFCRGHFHIFRGCNLGPHAWKRRQQGGSDNIISWPLRLRRDINYVRDVRDTYSFLNIFRISHSFFWTKSNLLNIFSSYDIKRFPLNSFASVEAHSAVPFGFKWFSSLKSYWKLTFPARALKLQYYGFCRTRKSNYSWTTFEIERNSYLPQSLSEAPLYVSFAVTYYFPVSMTTWVPSTSFPVAGILHRGPGSSPVYRLIVFSFWQLILWQVNLESRTWKY